MTTTDQQAVTVAQDDREAAALIFPTHAMTIVSGGWDETENVQVFARHRLASVSSASAETPGGTFACPICGKDTPHYHSPEEVKEHRETEAWVEESWQQIRPLIFPEPVPATNQAGEVEREAWERDNPFPKAPYGCEHWAQYLLPQAECYRAKAEFIRSLATQPATSQEGEDAARRALDALTWANEKLRECGKQVDFSLGMCVTLSDSEKRAEALRAALAEGRAA